MELPTYWHIELYSGEIIKVSPDVEKIARIQKLIASQTGAITTPTRSIIVKDIKDFRLSDEPYTDQKLLEDGAQAFKQALFDDTGSVVSRWVKKSVPRRRYETFYRFNSAYKVLIQDERFVVVAFRLPVHQIDNAIVQELNPIETGRVNK